MRIGKKNLLVCFTMESLWDVDCDVSTATLLVFMTRWGRLLRVAICMWNLGLLLFFVFIWRHHFPKLQIHNNPTEVLVSLDIRPYYNLTFYDA